MSLTTSVVLIAVFDAAVIAALAFTTQLPFKLGRRRPAPPVAQLRNVRLGPTRRAA